jgi:hypothetical protein
MAMSTLSGERGYRLLPIKGSDPDNSMSFRVEPVMTPCRCGSYNLRPSGFDENPVWTCVDCGAIW